MVLTFTGGLPAMYTNCSTKCSRKRNRGERKREKRGKKKGERKGTWVALSSVGKRTDSYLYNCEMTILPLNNLQKQKKGVNFILELAT